ncbi:MAG: serine/threonine protein kinase [Planctomycetes bacterium]|nr:serine/threonine protein kinase [Planctomycetota bacterium]
MANEASKAVAPASSGIGLATGAKIGKYEVRERLAVGGQAIVYKCYDSLLDRYVAVKQISSHLATEPKFLEMFRREAQILAKLGAKQKAIVSIHELVEDERGLFIIMEFVPGHTLEKILEDTSGPMEVKAGLQILWRLAGALYDVHNAGIVHRDIKPGNIIISEGMQPKITDFGVAANMSGQTSLLMGTTKYMAPELFGGSGDVDGRADMYSLGMIAYEMFIGRPKFNDIFADVVRDKHTEALRWMKWHGNDQVKAPPVHEVNSDVPKTLSYIVGKMMAKNRDERFKSMEDLGKAIKAGFSTRGRSAEGAMGIAVPTGLTEVGIGTARLPGRGVDLSVDAVSSALASTGTAGELETAPGEGPPTATLPKKKLSRKAKLIIVGAAALVLIGLLIAKTIQSKKLLTELAGEARTAYGKAEKIYNDAYDEVQAKGPGDENYKRAQAEFQAVYQKYRGKDGINEWKQASAMIHFAKARIAVENRLWQEAQAQEEEARKAIDDVQALTGINDKILNDWTKKRRADLENMTQERVNTRKFVDSMEDVGRRLEKSEFDAVRKELDVLAGIGLSPYQKTRIEDVRNRLVAAEALADYKVLRKKANDAGTAGSTDTKLYRDCLAYFETEKGKLLPGDFVGEEKKDINAIINKINQGLSEQGLIKTIEDHKNKKDMDRELNAILDYLQKFPNGSSAKKYADRATYLKVEILRRDARAARTVADKRRLWKELLKIKPDDDEAKAALAELDRQDEFDNKLSAANLAKNTRKWDEAIDWYNKALVLKPTDTEIPKLIIDCKWNKQNDAVNAVTGAGKSKDEIVAELRKFGDIDAARYKSEIEPRIRNIQTEADFNKCIADCEGHITGQKFDLADTDLRNAKLLYPGAMPADKDKIIADMSKKISYFKRRPAALDYIRVRDYQTALFLLKQMQKDMDTQEVRQLIAKCEDEIAKMKKAQEDGK